MPTPHTLDDKVMVVTGATSGIGTETAVAPRLASATVVMTARDTARGAASLDDVRVRSGSDRVEVAALDLADLGSVRRFAADMLSRHDRLDALVNNAGAMHRTRTETNDGFETTFGVNHLGHFLLTSLLLDRLKASAPSRVVNLSSFAHRLTRAMSWDDLQSERSFSPMGAYAQSKLANILFTTELARRLGGSGVTANAVHPGAVRSNFGSEYYQSILGRLVDVFGGLVFVTPEGGARTSVYLAADPEVRHDTGGYWVRCRRHRPSAAARDRAAARRLWQVSEDLIASVD